MHRSLNDLQLRHLRGLYAGRSRIDSDGLEGLRHSVLLEQVTLGETDVDDRGMAVLSKLPALEIVFVNGTRVTRAGVEMLMKSPSIELIGAKDTSVTVEDAIEMTRGGNAAIAVGTPEHHVLVMAGAVKP